MDQSDRPDQADEYTDHIVPPGPETEETDAQQQGKKGCQRIQCTCHGTFDLSLSYCKQDGRHQAAHQT